MLSDGTSECIYFLVGKKLWSILNAGQPSFLSCVEIELVQKPVDVVSEIFDVTAAEMNCLGQRSRSPYFHFLIAHILPPGGSFFLSVLASQD